LDGGDFHWTWRRYRQDGTLTAVPTMTPSAQAALIANRTVEPAPSFAGLRSTNGKGKTISVRPTGKA